VVIHPRLVYESRPAVRRPQSGKSSGPCGRRAAGSGRRTRDRTHI